MTTIKKGQVLQRKKAAGSDMVIEVIGDLIAFESARFNSQVRWFERSYVESHYKIPVEEWEPQYGEKYWYIYHDGTLAYTSWDNFSSDIARKNFLGVYPTKEACEKALEEIKNKLKK